jgi:HAD superfamily hydrolase (TIGR01662 family)
MRSRLLALCVSASLLATASFAAAETPPQLGRRVLDPAWKPPKSGKVKVAFFDADSTLRVTKSGAPTAQHATDVTLLPGVAARIKELNDLGYLVAIASNQYGGGKGSPIHVSDQALAHTVALIAKEGGRVDYYDFAEHYDNDRKPNVGMALRIESQLQRLGLRIDRAASFMVGDSGWKAAKDGQPADKRPDGTDGIAHSNFDRLFAENYKIPFHEAPHFFVGPLKLGGSR